MKNIQNSPKLLRRHVLDYGHAYERREEGQTATKLKEQKIIAEKKFSAINVREHRYYGHHATNDLMHNDFAHNMLIVTVPK